MKNLFKRYEYISKIFNNEKEETEVKTFNFDKKILDNTNNEEAIKELLREEGQVLMVAGTGTGKTYSLLETIKNINNNIMYIFAVPNRSQVLQISKEYNVSALYGGKNLKDTFKKNLIVSVYDKVDEIVEFCKKHHREYKLIIDEAHQVNLARYRKKAIDKLEDSIKDSKLTVFLTATPNALLYVNFRKIYNFVSKEDINMAKSFILLEFDKNLKTSIKSLILNKVKENTVLLIRYNDIEATKELMNDLKKLGLKCLLINSNEKDSEFDGSNIVYKNELTNEIINFSNLPQSDVYFTTSILDAGININSLNGSDDLSKLELVFVVKDSKDLSIDNIVQFAARPRKSYKCFNILKRSNDVINIPLSLEQNIEFFKGKINKEIEYIKANINLLMLKYDNNKEEVLRELNYQLNYKDLDNITNDFNSSIIVDKDLNVSINNKNLFYFCYMRANEQLYDNNKYIMDSICDTYTVEKVNNKNVEIDSDYKEEVNNILRASASDESKLKEIKGTEEYKNYNCLVDLGFEKEEAISILLNSNKSELETIKNDKVIDKMKKLNNNDMDEIKKVLNNQIQKIELSIRLIDLASSEAFDLLKSLNKKGLNINDSLSQVDTFEDLKYLNDNYQYIRTNIKYLNNEELKLKSEREQLEVINFFKQWDLTRQKLTNKKLEDLRSLLKDKFGTEYSNKKIYDYIKKILVIDEDKNIKGLKLK